MKVLKDRGRAHEAKHEKDQEREFKVTVRRNKLLGLWAAQHIGLAGEAAEAYAREVIEADFEEPGDEDVIRKVVGDFVGHGVSVDDAEVRTRLVAFAKEAEAVD